LSAFGSILAWLDFILILIFILSHAIYTRNIESTKRWQCLEEAKLCQSLLRVINKIILTWHLSGCMVGTWVGHINLLLVLSVLYLWEFSCWNSQ
jgi:hypothetical protein